MIYLVRYGEVALKGLNRKYFENSIVQNVLKKVKCTVKRKRNRIFVFSDEPKEIVLKALQKTFGIVSFSPVVREEIDLDKITETALKLVEKERQHRTVNTFKIATKRLDKKLATSLQINQHVGSAVVEKYGLKVQMKKPDLIVGIELQEHAHLFTESLRGPGGLPVGVEGTVLSALTTKDALYSTYLVLKRGCRVIPIIFEEQDLDQAERMCEELGPYSPYPLSVHLVKESELEDFMLMRHALALVTPDSLPELTEDIIRPTLKPLVAIPGAYKEHILNLIEQ